MKNKNNSAAEFLLILELPISWAIQSVGLMLMWNWFVIPVLNVANLGVWQAVGIILLLRLLGPISLNKIEAGELATAGLTRMTVSMFIIFVGWIVSLVV